MLNQFRSSYEAHLLMDAELKKLRKIDLGDDEKVISLSENFWETAQAIIEDLVNEYIAEDGSTSSLVMQKSNTSATEKVTLFRFDASACALTAQSGQSIKQVSFIPLIIKIPCKDLLTVKRGTEKAIELNFCVFAHSILLISITTIPIFVFQLQSLLCPSSPWNIIALYPQLERFCNEREAEGNVKPCRLRSYLHSFIVNIFIDQFKCKLETLAEQALNEQDAWRVLMHYPNPVHL